MIDSMNTVLMNLAGPSAASKNTNVARNNKADKKNDDNSFKSMLDKNTQKDTVETEKPDETGKVTQTEDKAEDIKKENGEEVALTGLNAESMAQFIILPEQERANINWGEAVEEVTSVEAAATTTVCETTDNKKELALDTQEEILLPDKETATVNEKAATVVSGDIFAEKKTDKVDIVTDKNIKLEFENEVKPEQHVEQKATVENKTAEENTDQSASKEETSKTNNVTPFVAAQNSEQNENLISFKVGDAIDMTSPKAEENLAETVAVKALERNNEFEIQLKPEELGTIKIKLLFENGRINVSMTCDNQKAVELLSASSGRLRELIQSNTGDEAYIFVSHENEAPYYEEGQRQNERRNGQQESENKKNNKHDESSDFIQQLRLGLVE